MTQEIEHAVVACAEMAKFIEHLKREMDEAAKYIISYLDDTPLDEKPHNWLVRNGYEDTSYQGDCFGQRLMEYDPELGKWRPKKQEEEGE